MIPGMVGKDIGEWIEREMTWAETVNEFGTIVEEIFVCYEEVADMLGKDEMKKPSIWCFLGFTVIHKNSKLGQSGWCIWFI
jgi:hypothetical protein